MTSDHKLFIARRITFWLSDANLIVYAREATRVFQTYLTCNYIQVAGTTVIEDLVYITHHTKTKQSTHAFSRRAERSSHARCLSHQNDFPDLWV